MVEQLEKINKALQDVRPETYQSIAALTALSAQIASWLAYTGQCKAEAKKALIKAKRAAYDVVLKHTKEKTVPPSVLNSYVNTMVETEEYAHELADRTNSACVHTLDLCRSVMSALKTELTTINNY